MEDKLGGNRARSRASSANRREEASSSKLRTRARPALAWRRSAASGNALRQKGRFYPQSTAVRSSFFTHSNPFPPQNEPPAGLPRTPGSDSRRPPATPKVWKLEKARRALGEPPALALGCRLVRWLANLEPAAGPPTFPENLPAGLQGRDGVCGREGMGGAPPSHLRPPQL